MNHFFRTMLVTIAAVFVSLFAAHAVAKPIGTVAGPEGSIVLYDDPGVCVGAALRAEYVAPGRPAIVGCWLTNGRAFRVVFLDGDVVELPAQAVKQPTRL